MTTGSLCLTLILMSPKPCSSNSEASHSADSTSASGVALPYFFIIRASSEPALTPMRIGMPASPAALATSLTRPSNSLMLPGLTRTAAQPASIAAKMYLGWKWMSAITGRLLCLHDRGERVGVLLARAGHPDDVAARRRQLGDLLKRGVDVVGLGGAHRLHRDRVVAADADVAHHQLTGLAPRCQHRRRRRGHAQSDGLGHGCLSLGLLEESDGVDQVRGDGQQHVADHHDEDDVGGGHQLEVVHRSAAANMPRAVRSMLRIFSYVAMAMCPPSNGSSGSRLIAPSTKFS